MAVELTYKEIDEAVKLDLEEELSFKKQIKEVFSLKFLRILFSLNTSKVDDSIKLRSFKMNKTKSKRSFLRRIRNPLTILGFLIIIFIATWGVHAPWISYELEHDLDRVIFSRPAYIKPNEYFWMGTTYYSRDVFGRLIFGTRVSMTIGLTSIIIGVVFGVMLGTLVAYQGGIVDSIVMRLVDVIMAFPGLILVILVVNSGIVPSDKGQTIQTILTVYGILSIPGYARLMRGTVLQEKTRIYVEAAKVSGASSFRVMFRHVLPNAITPILISVSFSVGSMCLSLAGLSFIGYGVEDEIEWGSDLRTANSHLQQDPHAAIWPGVGIMLSVLGFMLFGDGIRDALDPRSKA